MHLNGLSKPISNVRKRLIVKQKTIRVLLDTESTGDLLFIKKGSQKYIPTMKRAVPQSWVLPTAPFKLKRWVGLTSPLWSILLASQYV